MRRSVGVARGMPLGIPSSPVRELPTLCANLRALFFKKLCTYASLPVLMTFHSQTVTAGRFSYLSSLADYRISSPILCETAIV